MSDICKKVMIKMNEDFHRNLKTECAKRGTNMQAFIIEAIEEKLKDGEAYKDTSESMRR